jgi:helix-turn-helix protein
VRPVVAIPSLDELASEPDKVEALPTTAIRALYPVAVRLEAELRSRLLVGSGDGDPSPLENRALSLEEAATVLGMKPGTLYRKWRALGIGYCDADRRIKFTREALQNYMARRAGKGGR